MIVFWLVALAAGAAGAAVWFGWYRTWATSPYGRLEHLGAPWVGAGLLAAALLATLAPRDWPSEVGLVALAAGLMLALDASLVGWPRWVRPRWYRELEERGRAEAATPSGPEASPTDRSGDGWTSPR